MKQEPESEDPLDPDDDEDEAEEELVGRELSQLDVEQEEPEETRASPKKRKTVVVQSRPASSVPPPEPVYRMPTEERSVFWNGDEAEYEPILSPNAHRQLEEFDRLMGLTKSPHSPASAANGRRKSRPLDEQPVASSSKLPPSSPPVERPISEPPSDNDEYEIVPETDGSQTQEPELQIVTQPLPSNKPTPSAVRGGSKEKGRQTAKTKPLRPIPHLTPSAFHPHLKPPQSSLPESITNTSDDSRHLKSTSKRRPGSPIEEFDSPAPVDRKGKGKMVIVETARSQKESASEIWDSDVVQRGQQLAEAAKRRRTAELQSSSPVQPRRTVADIIAHSRSSRAGSGSESDQRAEAAQSEPEYESDSDEAEPEAAGGYHPDVPGTSTLAVPPASGSHLLTLPDGFELGQDQDIDESLTLEEMEFAYVDLSGGAADPHQQLQSETQTQTQDDNTTSMNIDGPALPTDPAALRQEEEESTQDVMMFQVTRPSPPPAIPPVMEDSPMITPTHIKKESSSAAKGSSSQADEGDDSDSDQQLQVPQVCGNCPFRRIYRILTMIL